MYKAYIEIPKGDTRRRHKSYINGELIDLGPIRDVIPVNNGIMPVHYGYILNTLNTHETPSEELDVLIFSESELVVSDVVDIRPIALMRREDGDHKIIATLTNDSRRWEDMDVNEKALLQRYFGYRSPISSIGNTEEAIHLIEIMAVK